uniref:C2 domain-containing protein n=1 Tax=Chromera velia CCMP2878 TaxID=1169474 RepID=A0A0G4HEV0_9ALVE|eukprot:Cvel_6528.t1-p1 / transcript=Cvel_6528.t1 / gene=Cvel_6528 / organism=Chromera_velia_CCMP2878 / gene_product=hypothetical protein / transcript_product=hypothetical protein / location=Cvel_scaffold321:17338-46721(-) / protein_length=3642 / sequence_SO=supercontig / SO=protein_coding / is_pseudo=false
MFVCSSPSRRSESAASFPPTKTLISDRDEQRVIFFPSFIAKPIRSLVVPSSPLCLYPPSSSDFTILLFRGRVQDIDVDDQEGLTQAQRRVLNNKKSKDRQRFKRPKRTLLPPTKFVADGKQYTVQKDWLKGVHEKDAALYRRLVFTSLTIGAHKRRVEICKEFIKDPSRSLYKGDLQNDRRAREEMATCESERAQLIAGSAAVDIPPPPRELTDFDASRRDVMYKEGACSGCPRRRYFRMENGQILQYKQETEPEDENGRLLEKWKAFDVKTVNEGDQKDDVRLEKLDSGKEFRVKFQADEKGDVFHYRVLVKSPDRANGWLYLYTHSEDTALAWMAALNQMKLLKDEEAVGKVRTAVNRVINGQSACGWDALIDDYEEERRKHELIRNFLGRMLFVPLARGWSKWEALYEKQEEDKRRLAKQAEWMSRQLADKARQMAEETQADEWQVKCEVAEKIANKFRRAVANMKRKGLWDPNTSRNLPLTKMNVDVLKSLFGDLLGSELKHAFGSAKSSNSYACVNQSLCRSHVYLNPNLTMLNFSSPLAATTSGKQAKGEYANFVKLSSISSVILNSRRRDFAGTGILNTLPIAKDVLAAPVSTDGGCWMTILGPRVKGSKIREWGDIVVRVAQRPSELADSTGHLKLPLVFLRKAIVDALTASAGSQGNVTSRKALQTDMNAQVVIDKVTEATGGQKGSDVVARVYTNDLNYMEVNEKLDDTDALLREISGVLDGLYSNPPEYLKKLCSADGGYPDFQKALCDVLEVRSTRHSVCELSYHNGNQEDEANVFKLTVATEGGLVPPKRELEMEAKEAEEALQAEASGSPSPKRPRPPTMEKTSLVMYLMGRKYETEIVGKGEHYRQAHVPPLEINLNLGFSGSRAETIKTAVRDTMEGEVLQVDVYEYKEDPHDQKLQRFARLTGQLPMCEFLDGFYGNTEKNIRSLTSKNHQIALRPIDSDTRVDADKYGFLILNLSGKTETRGIRNKPMSPEWICRAAPSAPYTSHSIAFKNTLEGGQGPGGASDSVSTVDSKAAESLDEAPNFVQLDVWTLLFPESSASRSGRMFYVTFRSGNTVVSTDPRRRFSDCVGIQGGGTKSKLLATKVGGATAMTKSRLGVSGLNASMTSRMGGDTKVTATNSLPYNGTRLFLALPPHPGLYKSFSGKRVVEAILWEMDEPKTCDFGTMSTKDTPREPRIWGRDFIHLSDFSLNETEEKMELVFLPEAQYQKEMGDGGSASYEKMRKAARSSAGRKESASLTIDMTIRDKEWVYANAKTDTESEVFVQDKLLVGSKLLVMCERPQVYPVDERAWRRRFLPQGEDEDFPDVKELGWKQNEKKFFDSGELWSAPLRDPATLWEWEAGGVAKAFEPKNIPDYCSDVIPHKFVMPVSEQEHDKAALPGIWHRILQQRVGGTEKSDAVRYPPDSLVTSLTHTREALPCTLLAVYPNMTADVAVPSEVCDKLYAEARSGRKAKLQLQVPGFLDFYKRIIRRVHVCCLKSPFEAGFSVYDAELRNTDDATKDLHVERDGDPKNVASTHTYRKKLPVHAGPIPMDANPAFVPYEWEMNLHFNTKQEMVNFVRALNLGVRQGHFNDLMRIQEMKDREGEARELSAHIWTDPKNVGKLEVTVVEALNLKDPEQEKGTINTQLNAVSKMVKPFVPNMDKKLKAYREGRIDPLVTIRLKMDGEPIPKSYEGLWKTPTIRGSANPKWSLLPGCKEGVVFKTRKMMIPEDMICEIIVWRERDSATATYTNLMKDGLMEPVGVCEMRVRDLMNHTEPFKNLWRLIRPIDEGGLGFVVDDAISTGEIHFMTRFKPEDSGALISAGGVEAASAAQYLYMRLESTGRVRDPFGVPVLQGDFDPNLVSFQPRVQDLMWKRAPNADIDRAVDALVSLAMKPPAKPMPMFMYEQELKEKILHISAHYMCQGEKAADKWRQFEAMLQGAGLNRNALPSLVGAWSTSNANLPLEEGRNKEEEKVMYEKLQEVLSCGFPPKMRGYLWMLFSGAYQIKDPSKYRECLSQARTQSFAQQRQVLEDLQVLSAMDIPGTGLLKDKFQKALEQAKEVCTAFLFFNATPAMYTQKQCVPLLYSFSIAQFALYALLPHPDAPEENTIEGMTPEDVFWLIIALGGSSFNGILSSYWGKPQNREGEMDEHTLLAPENFAPHQLPSVLRNHGMGGPLAGPSGASYDVFLLECCIAKHLTPVWKKMYALGFCLLEVFYPAFMSCYAGMIPTHCLVRLWDQLMVEAYDKATYPYTGRRVLINLAFGVIAQSGTVHDLSNADNARQCRRALACAFAQLTDYSKMYALIEWADQQLWVNQAQYMEVDAMFKKRQREWANFYQCFEASNIAVKDLLYQNQRFQIRMDARSAQQGEMPKGLTANDVSKVLTLFQDKYILAPKEQQLKGEPFPKPRQKGGSRCAPWANMHRTVPAQLSEALIPPSEKALVKRGLDLFMPYGVLTQELSMHMPNPYAFYNPLQFQKGPPGREVRFFPSHLFLPEAEFISTINEHLPTWMHMAPQAHNAFTANTIDSCEGPEQIMDRRISVHEFLTGLIICCAGSLGEKADLLFKLWGTKGKPIGASETTQRWNFSVARAMLESESEGNKPALNNGGLERGARPALQMTFVNASKKEVLGVAYIQDFSKGISEGGSRWAELTQNIVQDGRGGEPGSGAIIGKAEIHFRFTPHQQFRPPPAPESNDREAHASREPEKDSFVGGVLGLWVKEAEFYTKVETPVKVEVACLDRWGRMSNYRINLVDTLTTIKTAMQRFRTNLGGSPARSAAGSPTSAVSAISGGDGPLSLYKNPGGKQKHKHCDVWVPAQVARPGGNDPDYIELSAVRHITAQILSRAMHYCSNRQAFSISDSAFSRFGVVPAIRSATLIGSTGTKDVTEQMVKFWEREISETGIVDLIFTKKEVEAERQDKGLTGLFTGTLKRNDLKFILGPSLSYSWASELKLYVTEGGSGERRMHAIPVKDGKLDWKPESYQEFQVPLQSLHAEVLDKENFIAALCSSPLLSEALRRFSGIEPLKIHTPAVECDVYLPMQSADEELVQMVQANQRVLMEIWDGNPASDLMPGHQKNVDKQWRLGRDPTLLGECWLPNLASIAGRTESFTLDLQQPTKETDTSSHRFGVEKVWPPKFKNVNAPSLGNVLVRCKWELPGKDEKGMLEFEGRPVGRMTLKLERANNLRMVDEDAKQFPNPYVRLWVFNAEAQRWETAKTLKNKRMEEVEVKVMTKTNDPVWDQTLFLDLETGQGTVDERMKDNIAEATKGKVTAQAKSKAKAEEVRKFWEQQVVIRFRDRPSQQDGIEASHGYSLTLNDPVRSIISKSDKAAEDLSRAEKARTGTKDATRFDGFQLNSRYIPLIFEPPAKLRGRAAGGVHGQAQSRQLDLDMFEAFRDENNWVPLDPNLPLSHYQMKYGLGRGAQGGGIPMIKIIEPLKSYRKKNKHFDAFLRKKKIEAWNEVAELDVDAVSKTVATNDDSNAFAHVLYQHPDKSFEWRPAIVEHFDEETHKELQKSEKKEPKPELRRQMQGADLWSARVLSCEPFRWAPLKDDMVVFAAQKPKILGTSLVAEEDAERVRMMYDDRIPPERIVVALNQERRGEFKKKKDKGRTEKAPREITYREVKAIIDDYNKEKMRSQMIGK